jgi:hypothetical protein
MEPYPQEQTHSNTKQWILIGTLVIIIAAIGILLVLKLMPSNLDIARQQTDLIRWEQSGQIDNIPLAQQHFAYIEMFAEKKVEHAHAFQLLGRIQTLLNQQASSSVAVKPASPLFEQAADLNPGNYQNWLWLVSSYAIEQAEPEVFNTAMKHALRQGRNEDLALELLPEYILRYWDILDDKNRKLSARFFDSAFETHEWALHILSVTQKTHQYDVMLSLIPDKPKYLDIIEYYKQKDRG